MTLGTAQPKPARGTARRQKLSAKRQQAKADRLVYAAVRARDGHRCRVCRAYRLDSQIHHVIPRSLGGETSSRNCAVLCPECHLVGCHGGRIKITGDADDVLKVSVVVTTWNGRPESWAHYASEAR